MATLFQKTKAPVDTVNSNELSLINAGTQLEGLLETKGSVQINGKFKGVVNATTEVRVGRSGEIIGELHTKNARIAGKIEGNVFIGGKLILEKTSFLIGDLTVGKLVVEEGAIFNGSAKMK